jgi:antitoxin (DNA-binding transcriptional repressor) of toxin-antitoxin stability system
MIKINIHEAKKNFSRYLGLVTRGETIILCKRNVLVAEIRPIHELNSVRRPIGLAKGEFEVKSEFYDPLPDEIIKAFNCES